MKHPEGTRGPLAWLVQIRILQVLKVWQIPHNRVILDHQMPLPQETSLFITLLRLLSAIVPDQIIVLGQIQRKR